MLGDDIIFTEDDDFAEEVLDKSDIATLERILSSLYGGDRKRLAGALAERFGGAPNVFRATFEELMSVRGMTERAATFFTFALPLGIQAALRKKGKTVTSERDAISFAAAVDPGGEGASLCVFLDRRGNILHYETIGGMEFVRNVVSEACRYGAFGIILIAFVSERSSPEAIRRHEKALRNVYMPLHYLGIELIDYIEYSRTSFFSSQNSHGKYEYREGRASSAAPYEPFSAELEEYYTENNYPGF